MSITPEELARDFIEGADTPYSERTPEQRRAMMLVRQAGTNMTPEQRKEQAISFAYGNLAIKDPDLTRKDVREAYNKLHRE